MAVKNDKAPVFLVLSTKGGTGKSVVSQQVLATYNLKRFGNSKIVELDDENLDSSWLIDSEIKAEQIALGDDPDEFAMAVGSAIKMGSSGVVVDVGGNRTAKIVIAELNRLVSRASQIDAVCIPISDNRMGVENAIKTLEMIKGSPMGSVLLPKCFIALNRVRYAKATSIKDESIKRRFDQVVRLVSDWKLPVLMVHDMDGVENLSPLGLTVLEVADRLGELNEKLNKVISKASDDGNESLLQSSDNLQWAVNKASNEFAPLIINSHKQLDEILETISAKAETKKAV